MVKHFDFQNAFPNGILNCLVSVELRRHIFPSRKRKSVVMMLQQSLYGLKGASKIRFEFIKEKFEAAGLREMQPAPCVFHSNCIVAVCYVGDLLVFSVTRKSLNQLKGN